MFQKKFNIQAYKSEKSILDTKHKKIVLLLIEIARLYDEMNHSNGWDGSRFSVMIEKSMNQRGESNDFFISI